MGGGAVDRALLGADDGPRGGAAGDAERVARPDQQHARSREADDARERRRDPGAPQRRAQRPGTDLQPDADRARRADLSRGAVADRAAHLAARAQGGCGALTPHICTEYPPSTGIAAPVTEADAALARNTAIPAKSSGSPQRPAGVRASTRSCSPGICWRAPFVSSVLMNPGRIAFTWMLSFAHAAASDRVSWTIPPLLAPPKSESIEPMLTIFPPPALTISGCAA